MYVYLGYWALSILVSLTNPYGFYTVSDKTYALLLINVIAFTAGLGENAIQVREKVCDALECLGVKIDKKKNETRGEEIKLSTSDSKVQVYVIPTNEELMIAKDTYNLI